MRLEKQHSIVVKGIDSIAELLEWSSYHWLVSLVTVLNFLMENNNSADLLDCYMLKGLKQ